MAISTSPRRKASNTASPTTTPEAFSSTAPASPLPNLLAGLRWGTQEVLAPAAVLIAIVLFAGWAYFATYFAYFRVPVESLGLSLPEHGYHAPNENYDWRQTSGGIKMFVRYFDEISRLS